VFDAKKVANAAKDAGKDDGRDRVVLTSDMRERPVLRRD
jgi:citrate lyase beta subunit